MNRLLLLPLDPAWAVTIEDLRSNRGFQPPDQDEVPPGIPDEPSLRIVILTIVEYFLSFLGLIAITAIIYFGYLFIIAGGNEELYTKARKGILYVGIGIIVILFSYALVSFFINAAS